VREYEDRPLPVWTKAAGGFTACLTLLALSNDAHQLVFRFPQDFHGLWSEQDYAYGPAFYVIAGWAILCSALAIARMLKRIRGPKTASRLLAVLPVAAAIVYTVFYMAGLPPVRPYLSDTAVFYCLTFTAFFEGCIRAGLIRTNADYANLLRGERVVWAGAVTPFFETQEKLEDLRAEFQDRRELLEYEYEREKQLRTAVEQNRLYDLLQEKTQSQLNEIDALAKQFGEAETKEEKDRLLARIVLLGTYIKRRRNFVLALQGQAEAPADLLRSALDESARALQLLGVRCSALVLPDALAADQMTEAYDFFEAAAESLPKGARYLSVRIAQAEGEGSGPARLALLADRPLAHPEALQARFKGLSLETEEGETSCLLPLEGGAA
jgi:hypothetical protein